MPACDLSFNRAAESDIQSADTWTCTTMSTPPAYRIYRGARWMNQALPVLPPLSPSATSEQRQMYLQMNDELAILRDNIPIGRDNRQDDTSMSRLVIMF